jgi:hypothetical protein
VLVCHSFLSYSNVSQALFFIIGSIYLLSVIAECRMKMTVRRISGDNMGSLCRLIRFPTGKSCHFFKSSFILIIYFADTEEGKLIKRTMIAGLNCIRRKYPISLRLVFSKVFLDSFYYFNVTDLDCTDIQRSDSFFDKLPIKYVFFPFLN